MVFWFNLLLLGLSAIALTLSSAVQLGYAGSLLSNPIVWFNCTATICSYTVMRSRLLYLHKGELPVHQNKTHLITAIAVSAVTTAFCFFRLKQPQMLNAIALAVLTGAYFLPVVKTPQGWKRLRDYYFIKHFIVGVIWALSTVWMIADLKLTPVVWLLLAERLCFVASLSLLFDHRDLQQDTTEHHVTLLRAKGWRVSKTVSITLMLAAALLAFANVGLLPLAVFAAKLIAIVPALILIMLTNPQRSAAWYNILLEGMMVLYALVVVAVYLY